MNLDLFCNSFPLLGCTVMLLLLVRFLLNSNTLPLMDVRPAELAARFKEDGMLAYVELVQRKEKEIGCDVLTHQKWFVPFSKFWSRCVVNFYDTGAVPTTLIR